jgi:Zn-dependent peptidase ImmA (M78 family)
MNAAPEFGDAQVVLWSHRSVKALMEHALPGEDPNDVIRRRCRELVVWAKQSGWSGPPYDPEILASLIDIQVEPVTDDIRADARIFPADERRLIIQYTSSVSPERQRFSICHEIAHTRFPDCYEETRYRQRQGKLDWKHQELERLCNAGAAELLIPYDDFRTRSGNHRPSMQLANTLRRSFACSMEAMLYRIVDLAEEPCAVAFLSKRLKPREERAYHPEFDFGLPKPEPKYRVDYHRASKTFSGYIPQHKSAPESSVVYRVSPDLFPHAIEDWEITRLGQTRVQTVMLPMIADKQQERVAALFTYSGGSLS